MPQEPSGLTDAIIVDIDGTLALCSPDSGEARHRGINCRSWHNASVEEVSADTPNAPVIEIVRALADKYPLIFITGRKAMYAECTLKWLDEHKLLFGGFGERHLHMRDDADVRPDVDYKRQLYIAKIRPEHNIVAVFDDLRPVVRMWRACGLTVFDVADNDYVFNPAGVTA